MLKTLTNAANTGAFAKTFKISDVMQVYKIDESSNKNNYRPISILSNLFKTHEDIWMMK